MNDLDSTPDLIITARWIILNSTTPALSDHAISVKDGKIANIALLSHLKRKHPHVEIVGSDQFALMPGFVNVHDHSFGVSSIMRGVKDQVLEPWIVEMNGAPSLPKGLAAKLAAASLLQSGVTTTVDMCGGVGTLEEFSNGVNIMAQSYKETGIKTILAPGMRAQNLLSQADGEDAQFLAGLPNDLSKIANAMVCRERPATMEYIACVSEFISKFNDTTMTEIWFGPPGPQWCGMEAFTEISAAAENFDTHIQTHALESFSERLEGRCAFGESRIATLAKEGLLSSRLSLAHMVWASDHDIEIVADHNVSICHNPSSNLRLGAGIAPLSEFLKAGITVGLGLDGTSLNDDDDMFNEIRLSVGLHNARVDDKSVISHSDAYRLTTTDAAKVIGKEKQAGQLFVGAPADLILIDLERLEWPWFDPDIPPLELILARANRNDVKHVMVEGEWRVWNKELVDLNLKELGLYAAECLSATLPKSDRRAQTRSLATAVHLWHEAWGQNDLEGRAVYNSKQ